MSTGQFLAALGEIIGVNIVLSGDNAVVIALAARSLPPTQQKQAVLYGSLAAIAMRVLLTLVAAKVLALPWLKIIGSGLLLWIGVKLLLPEGDHTHTSGRNVAAGALAAIRTILIADLVMSLDNVIAVAAAAKGDVLLLVVGLAISIPLIVFGSTLILKLMDRFPSIITLGGGLLGFVAGEMVIGDAVVASWINAHTPWLHHVAPIGGALMVVGLGRWLAARAKARAPVLAMVDLAETDTK